MICYSPFVALLTVCSLCLRTTKLYQIEGYSSKCAKNIIRYLRRIKNKGSDYTESPPPYYNHQNNQEKYLVNHLLFHQDIVVVVPNILGVLFEAFYKIDPILLMLS